MPYEYRKLTPQQRAEVLLERVEHGFPFHTPPHPFRQAGHYLITAANFEHQPIMSSNDRKANFERLLLEKLNEIQAEIDGWVVLPNHYHVLIGVESLEQVSTVLNLVHGKTSREWNKMDGLTQKRKVWYHFSDRAIKNQNQYFRALNYIHYNPVKHSYVESAYDWEWSSLHLYYEEEGREWLRGMWAKNPPLEGEFEE